MERTLNITVYLYPAKENKAFEVELEGLVKASYAETIASISISIKKVQPATYIGTGKLEELKEYIKTLRVDTVVFNQELSGTQIFNLEKILGCKIIDKTNLILHIFSTRAKTKMSRLQVELCQLQYRLPRLKGYRNYLSREGGGIGTKGPGEQKLELDKRMINQRITRIQKLLKRINTVEESKRKKRIHQKTPIVSLVGYTNAGKSTLANQLVSYHQLNKVNPFESENLLFKTLDTTLRKASLEDGTQYIVADTIGFMQDMSKKLIDAFKSTLDEIHFADLIIVVVDSTTDVEMQLESTWSIIKDLIKPNAEVLTVFNKKDMIKEKPVSYHLAKNPFFMSAFDPDDIIELVRKINRLLFSDYIMKEIYIPYGKEKLLHQLLQDYAFRNMKYLNHGVTVAVSGPKNELDHFTEVNQKNEKI